MGERAGMRERIVRATAALLAAGGREAVSTRAVAAAAEVPTPTIYRLFGDMRGLLDAVAEYGFGAYMREKLAQERIDDPVEALRRGWDLHVEFGLANPGIYLLMVGDPRPGVIPGAAVEGIARLRGLMARVAEAGRLRVEVDRAVQIFHAAGVGVTLTLIGVAPEARDLALSATTREAILAALTGDEGEADAPPATDQGRAARRAIALKAVLDEAAADFTPAERALLTEWLDTIARPAR